MQLLEYTFTSDESAILSEKATVLANASRAWKFPPVRLEATTALYETLGPNHRLFTETEATDAFLLHNCPTHITPPDVTSDVVNPSWFMSNAMSGVIGKAQKFIVDTAVVPDWHQDKFKEHQEEVMIGLFCESPGPQKIPTAVLCADEMRANAVHHKKLEDVGIGYTTDSRGKHRLHLPPEYFKTPELFNTVIDN